MTALTFSARRLADVHVSESVLLNGIPTAHWHDPGAAITALQIWIRVGSADETPGATGLSHMLEHLMFRGTTDVPDGEFDVRMESNGVSINAATWLDYTVYTAAAPTDALDEVLRLEADRLQHLDITEEVFAIERDVVANERRETVDGVPDAQVVERLYATAYTRGPYRWPTIGYAEDIDRYTRDVAMDHYRRFYTSGHLMVTSCGPLSDDEMRDKLNTTLGAIPATPAPAHAAHDVRYAEDAHWRGSVGSSAPRVVLAWPAPPRQAPTYPAYALMTELLAGSLGGRLPRELVLDTNQCLDVNASLDAHRLPGLFSIQAIARQGVSLEAIRDTILGALDDIATQGPEPEACRRAKRRLAAEDRFGLATTSARAEWMGESWIVFGAPKAAFALGDALDAVDADALRSVARTLVERPPAATLWIAPTPEAT